jgi:chromosome segregation ATPase
LYVKREAKEKLEKDYLLSQETLNREKNSLNLKIFELENKKNDFENKNKLILSKVDSLKVEKNSLEEELGKKLESEKKKYKDEIASLRQNLSQEENTRRDLEKKIIIINSDHDRETALLKQRTEFYEKNSEQWEKKEAGYKEELKDLKEKLVQDSKDLKKKYEEQVSKLQSELFSMKDTLTEYQNVCNDSPKGNRQERRLAAVHLQRVPGQESHLPVGP